MSSGTTSYNYDSLPAGTHTITVSAVNITGESTQSSPITVTSTGTSGTGGTGGTGNTGDT